MKLPFKASGSQNQLKFFLVTCIHVFPCAWISYVEQLEYTYKMCLNILVWNFTKKRQLVIHNTQQSPSQVPGPRPITCITVCVNLTIRLWPNATARATFFVSFFRLNIKSDKVRWWRNDKLLFVEVAAANMITDHQRQFEIMSILIGGRPCDALCYRQSHMLFPATPLSLERCSTWLLTAPSIISLVSNGLCTWINVNFPALGHLLSCPYVAKGKIKCKINLRAI